MSHENEFQQMSVPELAQRCAQETQNFFQKQPHETDFCFELFRRAIVTGDDEAWAAVYAQYRPQVERWVYRLCRIHQFSEVDEEAQDFTMQALERFAKSYTEDKLTKSNSLAGVLSYLQRCVAGVILDCLRKMRYEEIEIDETIEKRKDPNPEASPEELRQRKEFWEMIKKKTRSRKEYLVVYSFFYLKLSPREILAEYPGEFKDKKEIYQHKANFLERMERDDDIKGFFR